MRSRTKREKSVLVPRPWNIFELDPLFMIVIIGIGEMAGVFARGFLKLGHPVFPVTRSTDMEAMARELPAPLMVLVAVAENDLAEALARLPAIWRERVALLQNELLPREWKTHEIDNPTVVAVWFEKKKGQDYKVLLPSPVYGPAAGILHNALQAIDIPAWQLASEEELLFELVRKNLYILTTNIAGLVVNGTVHELWERDRALAINVADEIMEVQFALIGKRLDRKQLLAGMVAGMEGDPAHKCMGRTAPARLARVIAHADRLGLAVPKLRQIHAEQS
jgi:ketopantoate reductase